MNFCLKMFKIFNEDGKCLLISPSETHASTNDTEGLRNK